MKSNNTSQILALIIDPKGKVKKILRDDFGFEDQLAGKPIISIIHSQHKQRFQAFLERIYQNRFEQLRQVDLALKTGPVIRHLMGARLGEDALVVGNINTAQTYFSFCAELIKMNNEQTNQLRQTLKKLSRVKQDHTDIKHDLYNKISEMNNELANTQRQLAKKNAELEHALRQVKQLKGLIPICANCKKIRDDQGYWEHVEKYISDHSEADFSHSICPDCMVKLYPEYVSKKATREAKDS